MKKQFCPQHHDTFVCGRDTKGYCVKCKADYWENYYKKNRNILIIKKTAYQKKHSEKIKIYMDNYNQEYSIKHKKEKLKYQKQYAKEHPEIIRANQRKAKIRRRTAIPYFGQDGINEFLDSTPVGMSDDHIIPLRGKLVNGLHVLWNLQYMPLFLNKKKNNKVDLLEASEWYGKILEQAGLK